MTVPKFILVFLGRLGEIGGPVRLPNILNVLNDKVAPSFFGPNSQREIVKCLATSPVACVGFLHPKKAARKGVFAWPVSTESALWTKSSPFLGTLRNANCLGYIGTKRKQAPPVHPNRRSNFNAWFWRTQRPQAFPRSGLLFATLMIWKDYLCVGKGKQLRTISTSHDGGYPVVIVPLWFSRTKGVLGRWFYGGCLPSSSTEESHINSSACLICKT